MENNAAKGGMTGRLGGVLGIVLLVLAAVGLYYFYNFMFKSSDLVRENILTSPIRADVTANPDTFVIPPLVEGGEYSVSFWTYIDGWASRTGLLKHILELKGLKNFSTMVVGLGGYKNSLVVRVSTESPAPSATPSSTGSAATTSAPATASASSLDSILLTPTYTNNLFGSIVPDQGLLATQAICDLPLVDMQRWVCITIVLNGRTIDVYMDGKLARSCVLPSFFRVDPDGTNMKILGYGGYQGYLSDINCYNYALNPEQVYRIYMSGPTALAMFGGGWLGWLKSIFGVKGTLTYEEPSVGVVYTQRTITL